jgi:hypothetical protein
MAEQGLDVADVGAAIEHVGGAGVAQQMSRAGFCDPGALLRAAHGGCDLFGGDGLAPVGDKKLFAGLAEQAGTGLGQIAVEPGGGAGAERHHAVFAAFALAHEHGQARQVGIVAPQPGQLRAAQAGASRAAWRPVSAAQQI